MDQSFEGQVYGVRGFPFAMREWERRIMYRGHGFSPSGQLINRWPDLSGNGRDAVYPDLPLWFRAWLWLRTQWAVAKNYGK